jgi:hypothetical protein
MPMPRFRRTITILLAALGVIAGTLSVATPAQATIIWCNPTLYVGAHGATVTCRGTSPSFFYVWLHCRYLPTGHEYIEFGPERHFPTNPATMTSSDKCPSTTGWVRVAAGLGGG